MMRNTSRTLGIAAAASAASLAGVAIGHAHGGVNHYPKRLFPDPQSYQQLINGNYVGWQTYSTGAGYFDCDQGPLYCSPIWGPLYNQALADWNGQPTTAFFQKEADNSQNYDVSVYVDDLVNGSSAIFGITRWFDQYGNECAPAPSGGGPNCPNGVWWFTSIHVGEGAFTAYFNTNAMRQATLAHELGHVLGLAHEPDDSGGGAPCGTNVDGTPVPRSIMNDYCEYPPAEGGAGLTIEQAIDVCGVNHVYPDPAYGQARCNEVLMPTSTAVPTATNTPTGGGGTGCTTGKC